MQVAEHSLSFLTSALEVTSAEVSKRDIISNEPLVTAFNTLIAAVIILTEFLQNILS